MKSLVITIIFSTLTLMLGCGQSNSPNGTRPVPPATAVQNADTQAPSETVLPETPVNNNSDSELTGAELYEKQIGVQQNMLYQEEAALDQAIKERNNQVHLGPQFMDTAAYGISTGALTWDFLRRSNYIGKKPTEAEIPPTLAPHSGSSAEPAEASAAESAATKSEEMSETTSTAATVLRDAGPVALRATEAVSAAVLGIFFVGKSVGLAKDVTVRFSDTNAIRLHRAKVKEAEKNLENAKANLAAIYFPENKSF